MRDELVEFRYNDPMIWLVTKALKCVFVGIALVGLAHVPIEGKPLWKHIKGKSVVSQRVAKKKAKQWFKDGKQAVMKSFKRKANKQKKRLKKHVEKNQAKKKELSKKVILPKPREMITASEEKKIQEILEHSH